MCAGACADCTAGSKACPLPSLHTVRARAQTHVSPEGVAGPIEARPIGVKPLLDGLHRAWVKLLSRARGRIAAIGVLGPQSVEREVVVRNSAALGEGAIRADGGGVLQDEH